MSKSPIKDYSRLLGQSRTAKKEDVPLLPYRFRNFESSQSIVEELKTKLDLSMKHNAKLLDENSVLSELIAQLKYQVKSLHEHILLQQKNHQEFINKSETERKKLFEQNELKQKNHQSDLQKLLGEVSTLHDEKNRLEVQKNKEIQVAKLENERNFLTQIQNLKQHQNNSKQLYQVQISNLKQALERKEYENQSQKTQNKLEVIRLTDQIKSLEAQTRHLKHIQSIELKDIKKTYEAELHNEKRSLEREKDLQERNSNMLLRRLKNQILDKNQEIDSLSKKVFHNDEAYTTQIDHLRREKEIFLSQLATAEVNHQNFLTNEKNKLRELNDQEIRNLMDMNENHMEELRSENNKLKNLLDSKSTQIRRIYQQNEELKKSFGKEVQILRKNNKQLKTRLHKIEQDHLEQLEAFKIKMAQLIQSNIQSLTSYYSKQIETLSINNHELHKINANLKQKLYKAMQDNDQMRKTFELEIQKQKARAQDLKIKLAAINVEHKEHVDSLGSKISMTSQTLIREAGQKKKVQEFFDEEKKKFHSLSLAKDKQINDLMETMHRMKSMHEGQIQKIRTEKKQLRDQVEMAEEKVVSMKQQFEEQIKIKDQKIKEHLKKDDSKLENEIRDLYEKNESLCNENINLQKQVEHLARKNRSLAEELGLQRGFVETLQLQSCAAIQDEKSKLKILMGNNEITMKEHFQRKIKSKQKDVQHLQKVLSQKEEDIRQLIIKYNGLEKRLEILLQNQEKKNDLEERIKNIGLDNNLIKNLAEMFSKNK